MPLESTLFWQDLVRLGPATQIVNNRIASAACYDPLHFFIAIVDFLVFGVGRYKREVPWRKLLSLGPVRPAYNRAMTRHCVYDGICMYIRWTASDEGATQVEVRLMAGYGGGGSRRTLFTVVMDSARGVRFGYHDFSESVKVKYIVSRATYLFRISDLTCPLWLACVSCRQSEDHQEPGCQRSSSLLLLKSLMRVL